MLRFEMDVTAADTAERLIEGVIVPYNETGRIAGVDYRFRAGSVRFARARTPLLLDHDRSQPIGVLEDVTDTEAGALGRFRIDPTPAGDIALAQAASGSRGSLSVGATVEASEDAGGVLEVTSGLVQEVSLLALGAFAGAQVTRVAAEADDGEEDAGEEDAGEEDEQDNPDETDEQELEDEEDTVKDDTTAPLVRAVADRRELNAGELVVYIVRAQQGEPDARRYLEAALTETGSAALSGLLPVQYEQTVLGGKSVARPLYETFRSRPLPGVGLQVSKPKWTTPPDGAWATDVNADATSTAIAIGSQTADVARWDWAGAFPWVVVQRASPDLIDTTYAEAVEDWYIDVEGKIGAEVLAAAPGVATTLGAAVGEFFLAAKRTPDVILMAPDVWGTFADAGVLAVSIGAGGVSAGSDALVTSFAGVPAIVSGTLTPGVTVLATRRSVDARVTEPVRLTANAIGALNVELAVVGEGLFDTDWPAELLQFAAIVPAIASESAGTGARRS